MQLLKLKSLINQLNIRYLCTQITNKNKLYSHTVLLPQTKFPLRLDNKKLIDRDRAINNADEFKGLYAWQEEHLPTPAFVLHDGPPYANGAPHMGHAINKILKDTIIRYKILDGIKVNYIPGWDCHGLPIELKAITDSKGKLPALEVRQKARNFAKQTIEKQQNAFESWGVIGDWNNSYKTFNEEYVKNQIRQFYQLYSKKLAYRDFKPVYWSPSSRTALAEAELEYNSEHKSLTATVKLLLTKLPESLIKYQSQVFALIWTTTPWTLPSNQAICYNSEISYSLIQEKEDTDIFLIATDLIKSHEQMMGLCFNILETIEGSQLATVKYKHPIYDIEQIFLDSNHVTINKGTGLVHAAPAHGPEDFLVALKHNIKINSIVDEHGCYTSEAGDALEGLSVFKEGLDAVLGLLKYNLVHLDELVHSYPYDWRTKQPVILRASRQWFIDTNAIKNRAVELLEDVQIIPKINSDNYKRNLISQLIKRPYWCISRQRHWGVPIPVFYHKNTKEIIINEEIIEHLCTLLDTHGPDFWWKLTVDQLVPEKLLETLNLKVDDIEKGQDIFDIWFDSGISWSSVLNEPKVADMYLEGTDQFTGWFQSSLMTSVGLRDCAPYKTIYVHGFALDENGLKMSKSIGNVIDPQVIIGGNKQMKPYGVDTLRWWVVCHANQDAAALVSANVLQASNEEVQKIRSVLRFAIGALNDFKNEKIAFENMAIIDKYVLHLLFKFQKQINIYKQEYQYNKICTTVINLLTNQISALYYTSIKDRLYCEIADDNKRKSAQFVLLQMFNCISRSIAPIVPHLVEEMYNNLPQKENGCFFQQKLSEIPNHWENNEIEHVMDVILGIKKEINKSVGANTGDYNLELEISHEFHQQLKLFQKDDLILTEELGDILQVANVKIILTPISNEYKIIVHKIINKFACNRCRKVLSENEDELCKRCGLVVENFNNQAKMKSY